MTPGPDLSVLPRPRKVALLGGSVKRSSLRSVIWSPDLPPAASRHVQRFLKRNNFERNNRQRASILIRLTADASAFHSEAYRLEVADQILLDASDEPGIFYGLQTLQQLLDTRPAIQRCIIEDRPALALRGFYFDLTRQVPTIDYLKVIVDRLAAAKINLLMIQYREFFPYDGFPLIVSESSYTAKEIAEFVRYAEDRCVQVVPLLQSLSMQEHILRGRAYAHLREQPGNISGMCPTHPESFRLYRSLAEQLMAAHPAARYFHMGADEANHVGQCNHCKRAQAEGSKATLVAGFTNRIVRFLADRGVKPVMWADMLFGHFEDVTTVSQYVRDMFSELSRDVVAADWDYWSTGPKTPPAHQSPYPGLAGLSHVDRLLDAGFNVLGAPSCSHFFNAERNAIDHTLAFMNITAFAKELRRRKCLGMLTTFWPTNATSEVRWYQCPSQDETVDLCYRQVRPGLEAHWYSIWRGAECAWSDVPRSRQQYNRAFTRIFFGAHGTSYPDALELASFPISSFARRKLVSDKKKDARLRQAGAKMRNARRSARRCGSAVTYADLFLRIQRHALQWRSFHDDLPRICTPKLSRAQVRKLRMLVTERKAREREFRRLYVSIFKDVHLGEEIELRFREERRLQEQLLWEHKRHGRGSG